MKLCWLVGYVLFSLARLACSLFSVMLNDDLGLGNLYGEHELKDNMDHASIHKVVESSLWAHFEQLV